MHGKTQFRNLLLNIIPRAASAAMAIALGFTLTVVLTPAAQAQTWTHTVLVDFNGEDKPVGAQPSGPLIFDAAGNLYGTTEDGGRYGWGQVFELMPIGGGRWTEKLLHSFENNGRDGVLPEGPLIFDAAGNLYGETYAGGAYTSSCRVGLSNTYGCGTVFELTPTGDGEWTEKVLHSFDLNGMDGVFPSGGVIFDAAGNLYGTASAGGPTDACEMTYQTGCGQVFELMPEAGGSWKVKGVWDLNGTDGANPKGGVIFDAAGNLYGTAQDGGPGNDSCNVPGGFEGCGTVFELSPNGSGGWTRKILLWFGDTEAYYPEAGLIFDAHGNLYSTTWGGGPAQGTVFELSPAGDGGWTGKIFALNSTDGSFPSGLIMDATGNLYGTAEEGGANGYGTVFELMPQAGGSWTETALYNFCPQRYCKDGSMPDGALLMDGVGNLYGMTLSGGTNDYMDGGYGTVFELSPN